MAEKNGNGSGNGAELKITRRPFKKGEKERHFELLAKNLIAQEQHEAKAKRCKEASKRILEDIKANGYAEDAQGELDVGGVEDDPNEARA